MSVLLLRLAGPMQAWGTQSRFEIRDTGMEPSKSGVIGLLCAALGRPRDERVDDLAALRMGVRVDQEGSRQLDYQTAGGTHRAGDRYGVAQVSGGVRTVTSRRYYLADADFLVGIEGPDTSLLDRVERALAAPQWQLFLGRKPFVPGAPVHLADGLREGADLAGALSAYPWPRIDAPLPSPDRRPDRLRVVLEASPDGGGDVRRDQPVGAAFRDRQFVLRWVDTMFLTLGDQVPLRED